MAKHDKSKVRIHTTATGRRQSCVRWYDAAGRRRQKCFPTLAQAKAFREELLAALPERREGGTVVWLDADTAARVEQIAKARGITPEGAWGDLIRDAIERDRARDAVRPQKLPRVRLIDAEEVSVSPDGRRLLCSSSGELFTTTTEGETFKVGLAEAFELFASGLQTSAAGRSFVNRVLARLQATDPALPAADLKQTEDGGAK